VIANISSQNNIFFSEQVLPVHHDV
jgi:hypothetical protein